MPSSLLTSYPGKALWTVIAFAFNVVRLPLFMIYYIPSSFRQHPSWTFSQALRVRILRAVLHNMAVVQMKTPLSLEPGKEGNQFVIVAPASQSYYVGPAADPDIKPESIGGTWYPSPPRNAAEVEYVVLHVHGGAFVIGDGRKEDAGFAANTFIKHTEASHVFCPQYRLASNPNCRFPAGFQDTITSYSHLVNRLGIDPKKVIISGDSAGANLAFALLRYLKENGSSTGLPEPAACWLWSPWVQPSRTWTYGTRANAMASNSNVDYIGGAFGVWGVTSLHPSSKNGLDMSTPYISSLGHAFRTDVPVYISTGECENLIDEDVQLSKHMEEIQGNKVVLKIEPKAPHDIILTAPVIGFTKEAVEAAKGANEFLKTYVVSKESGKSKTML